MALYPVILAGGGGKRLWPLSDDREPKPFLKMGSRETLFQATIARTQSWSHPQHLRVVCGRDHVHLVHRDLAELGLSGSQSVTLEPAARNTGPAVLLQALKLMETDANAVMVVLPADHLIEPVEAFSRAIRLAETSVEDRLILLGIVPTRPETGYGYIEIENSSEAFSVLPVRSFVEKPDMATAETYLHSGRFLWNAGIFIFRARTICEEFKCFQPVLYERVCAYVNGEPDAFSQAPNISIDVAVMELSQRTSVIPVDFSWNDVGNWQAAAALFETDASGNVLEGKSQAVECQNCLLLGQDAQIAGFGIEDLLVIAARGQVLVAPKNRAADLKKLVETLGPLATGDSENRPWGSFVVLDKTAETLTKRIDILPRSRTSLQKHRHRAEHWVVLKGCLKVTCNQKEFLLHPGQSTLIPQGALHRLENPGETMVSLIEVQMGNLLSEQDIVRFEDDYGRKTQDRSAVSP